MKKNSFIQKVIQLNQDFPDRREFHAKSAEILPKMGKDKAFWDEVFKRNLVDKGFLQRKWTMYDIPFFYVYECDDFYIKVHLFVPLKSHALNIAASAIHHHNNYMLTTYAAFGSGYETMLFEKDVQIDPQTREAKLKIRKHFHQKDEPVHLIDAWEPHVVINPASLSATLHIWSPDKKRATDGLRSNPLLKALKKPLRKVIYAVGLDKKIGIAAQNTYQFYSQNNKFYGVLEDDYFAPTRAQSGPEVDDYSVQTLFAFIQRMGFRDFEFLKQVKQSPDTPKYFHKWIDKILNGENIEDTYAKDRINIPGGIMTIEDILQTNKLENKL
ncbi:MAG: hypothetical protein HY062_00320 [Bacteroidetes bacterium]|nr:hypothetical protein [Bacteroidota bacterium]